MVCLLKLRCSAKRPKMRHMHRVRNAIRAVPVSPRCITGAGAGSRTGARGGSRSAASARSRPAPPPPPARCIALSRRTTTDMVCTDRETFQYCSLSCLLFRFEAIIFNMKFTDIVSMCFPVSRQIRVRLLCLFMRQDVYLLICFARLTQPQS